MPISNPSGVTTEVVDEAIEDALEAYVPEEVNYPEVVTHADLPATADFTNETFIVLVSTGIFGINRKRAGMWRSNGTAWYRLGALEGSGGVMYSTPPSSYHRIYNMYANKVDGKYQPIIEVETTPQ